MNPVIFQIQAIPWQCVGKGQVSSQSTLNSSSGKKLAAPFTKQPVKYLIALQL
jgi:hypothetical protein